MQEPALSAGRRLAVPCYLIGEAMHYRVIQDKGWSYILCDHPNDKPAWCCSGPWRYSWEAQEEADRLNGKPVADEQSKEK